MARLLLNLGLKQLGLALPLDAVYAKLSWKQLLIYSSNALLRLQSGAGSFKAATVSMAGPMSPSKIWHALSYNSDKFAFLHHFCSLEM